MRRVIGGVVLAIAGIPALFGAIMASGMTWAITEKWFSEAKAKEMTARVPKAAEAVWKTVQRPGYIKDKDTRVWVEAMQKIKPSPVEVARKAGIVAWLQSEIPRAFGEISDIIKGKKAPHPVYLDTKPLRQALLSPEVKSYVERLFAAMPSCEPAQIMQWQEVMATAGKGHLPACNPGPALVGAGVEVAVRKFAPKKDRFRLTDSSQVRRSFKVHMGRVTMWVLMLAALFLIVLGSLIGGEGAKGFLRWMGVATLLGAGGAALIAGGLKAIVASAWASDPSRWDIESTEPFWHTEIGREVLAQMAWFFDSLFSDLFGTVLKLAGMVLLLGLGLLVASIFAPKPAST